MTSAATPSEPRPSPSPSPKTPNRRRRLSSFHKPQSSPLNLPRTPLRRISTNRISGGITPLRTTNASPSTTASALKTPVTRTPGSVMRDRRRSRAHQPPLSREEIAAMYSETIKLCQDNKINARNTWSLNLIDYMPMLFKTGGNTDSARRRTVSFRDASPSNSNAADTNFQLAGVTLDAGVKIYCSRVDSVHTNAFKVLGGLSRTGGQDAVGDDEDTEAAEGNGGGDEDDERTRRRRGRRTGRSTLESNMANITSHKLETDLAVDPLFQKMSAAFDEGGAKGMLLNNLPVGPSGQVVFDSGEPADNLLMRSASEDGASSDSQPNSQAVYDISGVLPATPPGDADLICGTFLRFYRAKKALLDGANSSASEASDRSSTTRISADDSFSRECDLSEATVDFDYSAGDLQNAESLGVFSGSEQGMDSFATQDSLDDDDDVNLFNDAGSVSGRQSFESSGSLAFAGRRGGMDPVEAGIAFAKDSEYSFFDTSSIPGWAGPMHWRFRAAEATSSESSQGTRNGKKPKRPRGKTAMLLDFSSEAPKINFAKEFAQGKTATSYHLSRTVRDSFSEKKVTLPEDLHFTIRSLTSLFLKPNTVVRLHTSGTGASKMALRADDTNGWYDFDNDCDNENFCPDIGDEMATTFAEQSMGVDASLSTEVDLIPEPTRVEKIDINYAKVAKKVDVRQLKSGIWSQLCGRRSSLNGAAEMEGEEDEAKDESSKDRESINNSVAQSLDIRDGKSQRLQEVVQELPSFVPKTSLADVSLPYVFICLLHLANEKTLQISQGENGALSDLVITSGLEGPIDAD